MCNGQKISNGTNIKHNVIEIMRKKCFVNINYNKFVLRLTSSPKQIHYVKSTSSIVSYSHTYEIIFYRVFQLTHYNSFVIFNI